jgi:nucleotide-binding universal stress UspA family protein
VLEGGKIVGVLSLRDLHLVETLKDVDPEEVLVEDAMTPDPYTIGPDADLRVVAMEMATRKPRFGGPSRVTARWPESSPPSTRCGRCSSSWKISTRAERATLRGASHMTQHILCPIDLSECSHAALAQALTLAPATGSRLDVLHAYYVPEKHSAELAGLDGDRTAPDRRPRGGAGAHELDEFLARHGKDIRQRIDLHVVHKDPTSAILDFAQEHGTTLIVMGTHGRTGASRLFTGSVAERVVRRAPCPVLTVHEKQALES